VFSSHFPRRGVVPGRLFLFLVKCPIYPGFEYRLPLVRLYRAFPFACTKRTSPPPPLPHRITDSFCLSPVQLRSRPCCHRFVAVWTEFSSRTSWRLVPPPPCFGVFPLRLCSEFCVLIGGSICSVPPCWSRVSFFWFQPVSGSFFLRCFDPP